MRVKRDRERDVEKYKDNERLEVDTDNRQWSIVDTDTRQWFIVDNERGL